MITFPASPTFPPRFKRPRSSTFPVAPTFPADAGWPLAGIPFAVALQATDLKPAAARPQITLVDWNSVTISSLTTGLTGKSIVFPNASGDIYGIWFKPTVETQPDLSAHGVTTYVEVDFNPVDATAPVVAAAMRSAMAPQNGFASVLLVDGGGANTAVQLTDSLSQLVATATDIDTGAVISVSQPAFGPGGTQTTLTVSGAGTAAANENYILASTGLWISPENGWKFSFNGSRWDVLNANGNFQYQSTANGLISSLPSDFTYAVNGDGVNPAPTVTAVSSPFARTLGLFQDAGQTVPCVNWGDLDYIFADKLSTSGAVASQSVSTQRPALQWGPNGAGLWVPYLNFDGTDDFMSLIDGLIPSGDSPYSIFIAASVNTLSGRGGFFGSGTSGSGNSNSARVTDSGDSGGANGLLNFWFANDIETPGSLISINTPFIASFLYTSGNRRILLNGIQKAADLATGRNSQTGNNTLGCDNFGDFWSGRLFAFLVSDVLLSDTNVAKINAYLATLLPA